MSWARAAYRSRQFFGALRAQVGEGERAEVAAHLTPAEQALFHSMEVSDQRHALDVLRMLKAKGQADASLLAAALLHDLGKGRISVWQRVAFVLLNAVSPRLLRRLASGDGRGWRGALARSLDHAERGAALAEAAGSAPKTVRLIRLHRAPAGDDAALAMLQTADEAS
jgi:hypothetical protein